MSDFSRNHYVPEWFQYRFLPSDLRENKFFYLDLRPEQRESNGHVYTRRAIRYLGPPSCFFEKDLYTTAFGSWRSTELEENFFGLIDREGRDAVEYFASFRHPGAEPDKLRAMLAYMGVQKLRTPKGLADLAGMTGSKTKIAVLARLENLQQVFNATWIECVWSIADASESQTKFLLSDHPVTVYNKNCFPMSRYCRGTNDPSILFTGTHTVFPLSLDKVLILTNLSWLRNPYQEARKSRPNPTLFRTAVFNFLSIQTGRSLSEQEVVEINYIIKRRAHRYVAAAEKEWLFPERKMASTRWDKLGNGYLLMPDPRSVEFTGETVFGFNSGRSAVFDEYGRRPGQPGFKDQRNQEKEWKTQMAFKGEFARLFGPKRRGVGYEFGEESKDEDDPEIHRYHLTLEKHKPKHAKARRRK